MQVVILTNFSPVSFAPGHSLHFFDYQFIEVRGAGGEEDTQINLGLEFAGKALRHIDFHRLGPRRWPPFPVRGCT